MSTMLEKRIAELERHTGHVADTFAEHLSDDDAKFYTAIMRRWARSRLEFEVFVRKLSDDDVRRLHAIHMGALDTLGLSIEDFPE